MKRILTLTILFISFSYLSLAQSISPTGEVFDLDFEVTPNVRNDFLAISGNYAMVSHHAADGKKGGETLEYAGQIRVFERNKDGEWVDHGLLAGSCEKAASRFG
ncbi:MAG: hypothetical protein AAFR66_20050, partial [Bacteroidota bacterium]